MFLRVGDINMHVRVDGRADAPPFVLIHSLGTCQAVWEPQAEMLSERYRVIRPDLRGHGLTDVPKGPYAIDGMAREVLAVMDALGVARAPVAESGWAPAWMARVEKPGGVWGASVMSCVLA